LPPHNAEIFAVSGGLLHEGGRVPAPKPGSSADQRRYASTVAAAQGKENAACVGAAVKQTTADPDACLTADEKRKVGKAADKSTRDQAARCGGDAVPDFAADDARRVNASAQNRELALLSDLFGSSLVDVISTDRAVGNCQVTIVRGYERIVAAKLKEFVRCKKEALAAGVFGAAGAAEVLTVGYEELRRTALGDAAPGSGRGIGLALFLRSGMAAWMESCAALVPPRGATSARAATAPLVPLDLRLEVATLLAEMALAVHAPGGRPSC
jgi:hypothetical protein